MFESFKPNDWAIIFATLFGPVLAVQAQKWIERATEASEKKQRLFNTLMVTRGTQLAPEHVAALNSIDLVFQPSALPFLCRKDFAVVEAWRLYFQHLNLTYNKDSELEFLTWNIKREELFVELLLKMASAVGFKAERERMKGVYHPTGHFELERDQRVCLMNAARVFAGEQALKMSVTDFPTSQEAVQLHQKLQQNLLDAVHNGSVAVTIKQAEGNN